MMSAVERIVPSNIEAEEAVLGSLLIDPDAIFKVISFLRPDDFYRQKNGWIYEAIRARNDKGEPTDFVTVCDELEQREQLEEVGGASFIASLIDSVPTAAHVEHYAHIVERTATLRRLISAAGEIAGLAYQDSGEVEEIMDQAEQAIFSVSQRRITRDLTPVSTLLDEYFERIDYLSDHQGEMIGIPSGFADLDKIIGGFQPSDFIVIAGRPGMGKTSLALSIAQSVAVKHRACIALFSLEMSGEQLVQRLVSNETSIDSQRLRLGRINDEELDRVAQAIGLLSDTAIFIDDTPAISSLELRSKARRLHAEQGLQMIIVDYLQLMYAGRPTENRVQEISFISRSLKALARELRVPVVAVSQLSRAVESRRDKRPILSDLRESGCLTGDTLIMRADTGQLVPIKQLAEEGASMPVLTVGENLKLRVATMTKAFPSGHKRVYRLCTRSGRRIRASANHPFRRLSGWARLDELRPGDRIAVPRVLSGVPQEPVTTDENELILLAHLIGDGCYVKRQPLHYTNTRSRGLWLPWPDRQDRQPGEGSLSRGGLEPPHVTATLTSADAACLEAVREAAVRRFDVEPRLVQQENWYHLYLSATQHLTWGTRNPIAAWLDEELGIYGQRSPEKVIPAAIFRLAPEQIALFLRHLWATDGTISRASSGNRGYVIYYASTSRELVAQIQHLLLRLGILSTIRVSRKDGYRPTFQLHIQGRTEQSKFLQRVGIFGAKGLLVEEALVALAAIPANPNTDVLPKEVWKEIERARQERRWSLREFHRRMGWTHDGTNRRKHSVSRSRMHKILEVLPDPQLEALANSDLYWDEVILIEGLGVEEVYDATVQDTHNFIANDIIVHNSIEQDADVVIFIYRDEMYNEDSDMKSIAEIKVAKHRNGPTGQIYLRFINELAKFVDLERYRDELEGIEY
ncbi:MAG: replicative DNA helicase [Anaerolineae bacterium]